MILIYDFSHGYLCRAPIALMRREKSRSLPRKKCSEWMISKKRKGMDNNMLAEVSVRFPHLRLNFLNLAEKVHVLGIDFTVFTLFIIAGMLCGTAYILYAAYSDLQIIDIYIELCVCGIIVGIIGGRLLYVILNFSIFKSEMFQMLNLKNGGISWLGFGAAGFATCVVFSRMKDVDLFKVLDICCPGAVLATAVAKWGHMFSGTGFGRYTDNILAMQIRYSDAKDFISQKVSDNVVLYDGSRYIQVHPVFIYEIIACILLFIVCILLKKNKKIPSGCVSGLCAATMVAMMVTTKYCM